MEGARKRRIVTDGVERKKKMSLREEQNNLVDSVTDGTGSTAPRERGAAAFSVLRLHEKKHTLRHSRVAEDSSTWGWGPQVVRWKKKTNTRGLGARMMWIISPSLVSWKKKKKKK